MTQVSSETKTPAGISSGLIWETEPPLEKVLNLTSYSESQSDLQSIAYDVCAIMRRKRRDDIELSMLTDRRKTCKTG